MINIRGVHEVDGNLYYQTIITDKDVSGSPTATPLGAGSLPFSDESFVRAGGYTGGGVAVRNRIQDEESHSLDFFTDTQQFAYDSTLLTGWAQGPAATSPRLQLNQSITETGIMSDMDALFSMTVTADQSRDIALSSVSLD